MMTSLTRITCVSMAATASSLLRGGLPPLDYETVAARAFEADVAGQPAPVASLRSIVGFKRLAGRPRDRNDLEELEALNGQLPIDPIPGLDT